MQKFLLALLILFPIAGFCEEKTKCCIEPASGDSIKILSVSPEKSEVLKVGQKVKFSFNVEYTLNSAESGNVVLVIQTASVQSLGNELYIAQKGTHTETLEAEITIPDTRAIIVFTPLSGESVSGTSVVQSVTYKVSK